MMDWTGTSHTEALQAKIGTLSLEAQEKLERNHDVMSKERVRLRDHHSKSWSTTWITLLSLIVVVIGFFMTFLVIRVT